MQVRDYISPLEVGQPQKGLIEEVIRGELQKCSVKSNEDGNLNDRREAACERIHIVGTVQSTHFALHYFRVGLIPCLDCLDLRK